jgi:hypothetical protein
MKTCDWFLRRVRVVGNVKGTLSQAQDVSDQELIDVVCDLIREVKRLRGKVKELEDRPSGYWGNQNNQ